MKNFKIKVLIIVLLCLLVLFVSGASRLPLSLILNEYEEECLEYEMIEKTQEYYWYNFFNTSYEMWDYKILVATDNCIKYHIVRNVK